MKKHSLSQLCAQIQARGVVSLVMACVSLGCGTSAGHDQQAACPAIEMTAVADSQTASTKLVALNDSTKVSLDPTPLVTSADITGASASLSQGQWIVNFDVTDEASKRIHDFSAGHVGSTVALLVDGKVKSTPKIMSPITGKGFKIGEFDQADAERLASALSHGCKR